MPPECIEAFFYGKRNRSVETNTTVNDHIRYIGTPNV